MVNVDEFIKSLKISGVRRIFFSGKQTLFGLM